MIVFKEHIILIIVTQKKLDTLLGVPVLLIQNVELVASHELEHIIQH